MLSALRDDEGQSHRLEEHKMLQRVPAHHGLTTGIGLWPIMDSQLIGSCPLAAMSELPSIAEQCLGKSASLHEPKECLVLQALHGNIVWTGQFWIPQLLTGLGLCMTPQGFRSDIRRNFGSVAIVLPGSRNLVIPAKDTWTIWMEKIKMSDPRI
ncbi:uncharacterized protein LOC110437020 isoform X2 [Sorghum bicolor]|uniref:uncharacterized protein LOC110437020 isoform X2 n=1 Tax=Sorghum bicolor TaxID=4558 RepID=UPI000B4269AB|nr:uncharacterized protein LOC110437020 isoform X2 [Sorghum bicolor]|eukprot:XP_021320686.1 uncharacterized protein LOC110437020 isoform X2 [Sorghum bicolor]